MAKRAAIPSTWARPVDPLLGGNGADSLKPVFGGDDDLSGGQGSDMPARWVGDDLLNGNNAAITLDGGANNTP